MSELDEQMAFLAKGTVDLIEKNDLRAKLQRGKPLTIKVGFDPTAPDIHLGHAVVMRKMRHFQQLGHRVVFLIGDFTGMIGDPTGKKTTRPALSTEEILNNAETYKQQVFKILDPVKTEVRFNSEWLGALGSEGMIRLAAKYTLARMLERIGTVDNIPDFLNGVKEGKERLMGFGHRVYKNYDPRARIIKKHVDEVLEATEPNPKLDIAVELEKRALDDDYFTSRKLYPNVDFYSGLIYEALNLPTEMFTVMFAIPRTSGWVAQWLEMVGDKEQKIARPRQIYAGERDRDYVPLSERG